MENAIEFTEVLLVMLASKSFVLSPSVIVDLSALLALIFAEAKSLFLGVKVYSISLRLKIVKPF